MVASGAAQCWHHEQRAAQRSAVDSIPQLSSSCASARRTRINPHNPCFNSYPPQGIVSCNQLVRLLVPLLVDATAASLDPGSSTTERQAAIRLMLQQRLATNTGAALRMQSAAGMAASASQQQEQQAACPIEQLVAADARLPAPIDTTMLVARVPAGRLVRLTWDAADLVQHGAHGLLLLTHAAQPCSQLSIAAVTSSGLWRPLAATAAVLPPLLPELQQRWVPRHWEELLQGIDWQQNATRLLYVPFASDSTDGSRLHRVDVAVQGGAAGSTAVLAQVLAAHPDEQVLHLPAPGSSGALDLPAEHAPAVALQLPEHAWPLASGANAAGSSLSLGNLAALLQGPTPPWSLRIRVQQCESSGSSSNSYPAVLPAVAGLAVGGIPGDAVRVGQAAMPGNRGAVVPLWDGLLQRSRAGAPQLLLISHPSCSYTLR